MSNPTEGNSPSSSSEEPPKADDISNTTSERDAQETDQGQASGSQLPQPPCPPLYYTRSAARRLPPPSPGQLRAGKLLMKKIDRRPHRPRPLTVLRQTTTSRIKPPVPPAQPSPSGIVPLGPPPPRQPLKPNSPPPAAPVVGRFDHLPPPSLSFDDAWKFTKDFVEGLEKMKDELDESKFKASTLALQVNLRLPTEVSLFDMFDSSGKMEDIIDFVCDYFQTSEVPPADDD